MKITVRRVAFAIAVVFLAILGESLSKELEGDSVRRHPAVKAYNDMKTALRVGDYRGVWLLMAKEKREKFDDSFDIFLEYLAGKEERRREKTYEVEDETGLYRRKYRFKPRERHSGDDVVKIVVLSRDRVVLIREAHFKKGGVKAVYMVNEKGWKVGLSIHKEIARVDKHLGRIYNLIRDYYRVEGKCPRSLSEFVPSQVRSIPLDPFNVKKEPYRYKVKDNSCTIYSVGPDQKDDQAMVEYDARNGVISQGDIIYTYTHK